MSSLHKKTLIISIFLVVIGLGKSFTQETFNVINNINWHTADKINDYLKISEEGAYNDLLPEVSLHHTIHRFKSAEILSSKLTEVKTEIIEVNEYLQAKIKNYEYEYSVENIEIKKKYELNITVNPVRITRDGKIERLISYNLEITFKSAEISNTRNPEATFTSVLSSGDIYKIKINQSGIHKIDRNFLESKLGINLSNVNPKKIKIYGNKGGRVPEANNAKRTDDLEELSILISGEDDGKFDAGDFILFYAEGADIWNYNASANNFVFDKNIYDDFNYYFIKIDSQDGLRVQKSSPVDGIAGITTSTYDMIQHFEEDKINLLGSFAATEGTGKQWFGDIFGGSTRERIYTSKFDFSEMDLNQPMEVEMVFAGRSRSTSNVTLSIGNKNISRNIGTVNDLNFESLYARRVVLGESFINATPNPIVRINYPNTAAESTGWLDYIRIISGRELSFNNTQLAFRSRKLVTTDIAAFNIKNFTSQTVWDITNPFQPIIINIENNQIKFRPQGLVREFIAHNNLNSAIEPTALGKITNQNLHAIKDEDMIIVYHPNFKSEALRLADHRAKHSGIKVLATDVNEIYNEFSGGKADPGAIRDMARLLLFRNAKFKYLLLFGDGSYDYKGIVKDIPSENFIPVYETDESLDPIEGFPSDDFYGLLGDNEGVGLRGGLDIYVGRLPAKTIDEAKILVDKIIHYETSPATLGDWRLRNGYVGDDEDGNVHTRDVDNIARLDENRHPIYNQQKVYADAYKQVSTSGEKRFPDVNKGINDNIFKGQLSLTYLGHGGPLGWAQERILTVPDLESWTNINSLTVLVTATCSFGAYDDPSIISPAEFAMLNAKGGAIALMTTTRAVYTNSNYQLTDAAHELMYKKVDGKAPSMGYILSEGKNKYQGESFRTNSRKFALLGDPSLQIAMPKLKVVTEKINGQNANTVTDTLNALERVTIEGFISDDDGNLASGFNGTIFPTVYDKKSTLQTLSNDGESASPKFTFTVYKDILFKGSATVTGGKWSFSFWVPKNINYSFGKGRISYYASDGNTTDAGGLFENVIIGGTNPNLLVDDQGPKMDPFMNDESFISGGMTNANPTLLLNLSDDFGINVTGNAIGQDITAVLDGDTKNIFILNEFYESKKDDYTSGIVRFPLADLKAGSHYIIAKAWDISGNSTERRLDFMVTESGSNKLNRVYNYPNPFTSRTSFQFDHDLSNTELEILVNIYTITGKLVKSITETKYSSGFRVNDISWNGTDDFDSGLARGIYLYKIHVFSKELNITRESNFEKLVKL